MGWWIRGLAAAASIAALIGLRAAQDDVAHRWVTLDGGIPALVYEPVPASEAARAPAIVLAHGLSADPAILSTLARCLARAGYGVVTPALRGHGANTQPFPLGRPEAAVSALRRDLDAAVLFARTSPGFDPERVAIGGHGLGAVAALDYASIDPSVGAVIAISGVDAWSGAHTPPNVLLLYAASDGAALQERVRRVGAQLAQLKQVVVERIYGEPARGSALKTSEVAGANHLTILFDRTTSERARDWLAQTIGPGSSARPVQSDGRVLWSLVLIGALGVLLWNLGDEGIVRSEPQPEALPDASKALAVLTLAVALLAALLVAGGAGASRGPLAFVPLAGAREVVAVLALAGIASCIAWRARPSWRSPATGIRHSVVSASILFAPLYAFGGAALEPWTSPWPDPHRLVSLWLTSAVVLPFFYAVELRLRGAGGLAGWTASVASRALVIAALLTACGLGTLAAAALPSALRIAAIFFAFELLALRWIRTRPDPMALALVQSLWLGWALAATAPLDA